MHLANWSLLAVGGGRRPIDLVFHSVSPARLYRFLRSAFHSCFYRPLVYLLKQQGVCKWAASPCGVTDCSVSIHPRTNHAVTNHSPSMGSGSVLAHREMDDGVRHHVWKQLIPFHVFRGDKIQRLLFTFEEWCVFYSTPVTRRLKIERSQYDVVIFFLSLSLAFVVRWNMPLSSTAVSFVTRRAGGRLEGVGVFGASC